MSLLLLVAETKTGLIKVIVLIILSFFKRLFEWITNMKEEFIIGVLHNEKINLGYGGCSKYLAYPIKTQVVGFGIMASVVGSFFR